MSVATANAAVFSVSTTADSGPGSLRQAISDADAAPSPPHTIRYAASFPMGGTTLLSSPLPVVLNGSLTVDGNGRAPWIDGGGTHPILQIGASVPVLSVFGVNFRRGARLHGGCIALTNPGAGNRLDIDNARFEQCRATAASGRGGAIDWRGGATALVTLDATQFDGNSAGEEEPLSGGTGGAIYVEAALEVSNSRFSDNVARIGPSGGQGSGGAIDARIPANRAGSIQYTRFERNRAGPTVLRPGQGGAIATTCAGACMWTIERSYFRANEAHNGGAIFGPSVPNAALARTIDVRNSTFVGNRGTEYGGAIRLVFGDLVLRHNSFFDNGDGTGGHLSLLESEVGDVVNNVFGGERFAAPCHVQGAITITGEVLANRTRATCVGLPVAGFTLIAALPDPVIDDATHPIGVIRYDGDARIVDSGDDARCAADDARFNARPQDGDGNGVPRCDPGAFEHPRDDRLFTNGFEP